MNDDRDRVRFDPADTDANMDLEPRLYLLGVPPFERWKPPFACACVNVSALQTAK